MSAGDWEVLYSSYEQLDFQYTINSILYEDGTKDILHQSGTSV